MELLQGNYVHFPLNYVNVIWNCISIILTYAQPKLIIPSALQNWDSKKFLLLKSIVYFSAPTKIQCLFNMLQYSEAVVLYVLLTQLEKLSRWWHRSLYFRLQSTKVGASEECVHATRLTQRGFPEGVLWLHKEIPYSSEGLNILFGLRRFSLCSTRRFGRFDGHI